MALTALEHRLEQTYAIVWFAFGQDGCVGCLSLQSPVVTQRVIATAIGAPEELQAVAQ
jgi:hypothetical protein